MTSLAFDSPGMTRNENGSSILIAGPPFRGYLDMIAAGFAACGLKVATLPWRYLRRSLFQEIMYYSSESYRRRLGDSQDTSNAGALEKAVVETAPDYVLVVKAVEITDRTKDFCKDHGIRLALWAYDSATEFPIVSRAARAYDLVYTYEPADLETLSKVCRPKFLPMAFDPRFYFPLDEPPRRTIDICFVGGIDFYPLRRKLIKSLGKGLRDRKISVWTDSAHWYSHRRIKDLALRGFRPNITVNRSTKEHASINSLYNQSKVCLNIHHRQSKEAINPRTFEVLGSGGLLVTDRKMDRIDGFEDGKGFAYYADERDLLPLLREILSNDELSKSIAAEGHRKIMPHTYERRARTIVADLRKIG